MRDLAFPTCRLRPAHRCVCFFTLGLARQFHRLGSVLGLIEDLDIVLIRQTSATLIARYIGNMLLSLIGIHHLLPLLLILGQLDVNDRGLCITLSVDKLHLVLLSSLDLGF